ncbi:MAG: hypothetical protein MI717_08180 [Spirochaetales bacterium]|nr:hypothetical protein [Spirochaetales bacterium]
MGDRWDITWESDSASIQFLLRWSPWGLMDPWVVTRRIPSEAGIFQIWTKDAHKGLTLLLTETAYYGGLRHVLREALDPLAPAGMRFREQMGEKECWFRYCLCSSHQRLMQVRDWFGKGKEAVDEDGRTILVAQRDVMRRFPIPPPDVVTRHPPSVDEEYGPVLPKV